MPLPTTGLTPREVARYLRVSPDRVRSWIKAGVLRALNTAPSKLGKPRFIILPADLEQFAARQEARPAAPTKRRSKKHTPIVDYYP